MGSPPPKSGYVIYEWYLLIPAKLATFPRFGVNDAKGLQTTLLTFANKFFVGIILHWPPKKGTTAGAASASVVVVPSSFIRTNWAQFEADLAFKHGGYSEFSNTVSYIDILVLLKDSKTKVKSYGSSWFLLDMFRRKGFQSGLAS